MIRTEDEIIKFYEYLRKDQDRSGVDVTTTEYAITNGMLRALLWVLHRE